MEQVFYTPATEKVAPQVIDIAVMRDDEPVGVVSGLKLQDLRVKYPGTEIGSYDAVLAQKEAMLTTQPTEISEKDYWDALEALPPEGFRRTGQSSSFKMSEYFSGRITTIYVCTGKRYFCFKDQCTITHENAIQKVHASQAWTSPSLFAGTAQTVGSN